MSSRKQKSPLRFLFGWSSSMSFWERFFCFWIFAIIGVVALSVLSGIFNLWRLIF